ncbi:MAG TPA: glycosyltransferase, partial [Aquihabitans sp.]|nr:glycosyltransferase [Aquihabitans sp.]
MTTDQPTDHGTTAVPRTYLAALADGGGTVPPELGAVRRLVERGHRVTVLGEDSFEADARATGATFRRWEAGPNRPDRLPANDPLRDWEVRSPMRLFDRLIDVQLVGPAAAIAADVAAAIAVERPDAILSSQFTIGAMAAAEAAGIPFAVLMPNIYTAPAEGLPPLGAGFQPARGSLGRLRDRAVSALTGRAW